MGAAFLTEEYFRFSPALVSAVGFHMCSDNNSVSNRCLTEVADVKPACKRIFAKHVVKATHHRRIEDRGDDTTMHNSLITMKTMFHHHFTVYMIVVLEELQSDPIRIAVPADKAS